MTTIEEFTSQYGLVKKIDAFGFMKYLHDNPDAPRKHGKVVFVTADTPLKASRGEGKTTTTIALIDALQAAASTRPPCCASRAWASPQPVPKAVSRAAAAWLTHPELIDWGLCGEIRAIPRRRTCSSPSPRRLSTRGYRHDPGAARLRSSVPLAAFHRRGRRQEQRAEGRAHADVRADADRRAVPFDG